MDILLAHPDRDFLTSFRILLTSRGHRVAAVFDATQVVSAVSRERFDAAVIHMGLPRMRGTEVYAFLKESAVPYIALTDGRISRRLLLSDAAAEEYISFPFTVEELCVIIEDVLLKKRSGKKLTFGNAVISVPDFSLNGAIRLTSKEIDIFEELASGEGDVRDLSARYADSLDEKLDLSGCGVRIKYIINEGYRLVESYE